MNQQRPVETVEEFKLRRRRAGQPRGGTLRSNEGDLERNRQYGDTTI